MGVKVYVIAPHEDDASYLTLDPSLSDEIHPDITLIKTRSFEPLNLYKKIVGKKNVPTAGMSNVDASNFFQGISLFIRSNLFIPDPRKFWKRYALKAARKLIKEENIEYVITTSPPHSVQTIGIQLKREFNITWIADLRDLWTGIYYYDLLKHSKWSKRKDQELEQLTLRSADHITTVSPMFKEEFLSLSKESSEDKISVIPNGYDPADFSAFQYEKKTPFKIVYTGTISDQYFIEPFLNGLDIFRKKNPDSAVELHFVGMAHDKIKQRITDKELHTNTTYHGYLSHSMAIKQLEDAAALLLVGPLNQNQNEGSIPAKLFEYLASARPIIYIGKEDGYVARIIEECEAGRVFGDSDESIANYLQELYGIYSSGTTTHAPHPNVSFYSREEQARRFLDLLVD